MVGLPDGPVHQTGACMGRSRADVDRMQHGFCFGVAQDNGCDGSGQLQPLAAARCRTGAGACSPGELKEHRFPDLMKLLTRGLHSRTRDSGARATGKVPRSGVGRCGNGVFLEFTAHSVNLFGRTLYYPTAAGYTAVRAV